MTYRHPYALFYITEWLVHFETETLLGFCSHLFASFYKNRDLAALGGYIRFRNKCIMKETQNSSKIP